MIIVLSSEYFPPQVPHDHGPQRIAFENWVAWLLNPSNYVNWLASATTSLLFCMVLVLIKLAAPKQHKLLLVARALVLNILNYEDSIST